MGGFPLPKNLRRRYEGKNTPGKLRWKPKNGGGWKMMFLSNTYGIYGTGLLTYIYHILSYTFNQNVVKYNIHGSYGRDRVIFSSSMLNFTGWILNNRCLLIRFCNNQRPKAMSRFRRRGSVNLVGWKISQLN